MNMELSSVFNAMNDALIVLDKEGRVSQSNVAAQKITGYADEAIIGIHILDLFCGKAPYTIKLLETGESYRDREMIIDGVRGKSMVPLLENQESTKMVRSLVRQL